MIPPSLLRPRLPEKIHAWIFTDGSCYYKDRIGGWAGCILLPHASQLVYGASFPTTVARCELEPLLAAMRELTGCILKRQSGLVIAYVTDSESTAKMVAGIDQPEGNTDLWEHYRNLSLAHTVIPHWRPRNSHPVMSYVDGLAVAMREELKPASKLFLESRQPKWEDIKDLISEVQ